VENEILYLKKHKPTPKQQRLQSASRHCSTSSKRVYSYVNRGACLQLMHTPERIKLSFKRMLMKN